MDSLPVCQEDNAQVAIFHLWHLNPMSEPAILLNGHANWSGNCLFQPFVTNRSPIWADTN